MVSWSRNNEIIMHSCKINMKIFVFGCVICDYLWNMSQKLETGSDAVIITTIKSYMLNDCVVFSLSRLLFYL